MTAMAPDHDEIVRFVQLYVDGFNDGDIGKSREAFHENAWIFFTDADGGLHKDLLADAPGTLAALAASPPWPSQRAVSGRARPRRRLSASLLHCVTSSDGPRCL